MRYCSIFATLLLAACGTIATNEVPEALIQDCPEPLVDTRTNGGLARGVQDLRASLRACNIDKRNLRDWKNTK